MNNKILQDANSVSRYSLTNLWRAIQKPILLHRPVPPKIQMPDDWEIHSHAYTHDNTPKECNIYHSPSRSPDGTKGTVFYSLGWKTHPLQKLEVIEDLQNSGFSVLTIPLVESSDKIGTMAENITRMESSIFNEHSVIHSLKAKDAPLFVMTHSTSATVFETAQLTTKFDDPYNIPKIDFVIHTNPFINARGVSTKLHPVLSKIYNWHASKHSNEHAGIPFLDRAFYYVQGLTEQLINEDPRGRPTHGQVLEIGDYGNTLLESKSFAELNDPPVAVFISKNDDFACPQVAEDYFNEKMNTMHIFKEEAGHNILLQPDLRKKVIGLLENETRRFSPSVPVIDFSCLPVSEQTEDPNHITPDL